MMDIKRKRKEEYEIDPNSSFNKLRKLQMTLKEEVALTDIFFENRDDLLKKIESNCLDYYRERISIQEIYDHNEGERKKESEIKHIKYEVSEKPQAELPQCYDPLYKLMFYFRNSNDLTLKLIENCPNEKDLYEILANFICNYYYVNIFSSTFLNENLLTLIYLLLEKEIDQLSNEKSSFFSFLDQSKSFTAVLLKHLARRDEVKTYLENVLKKLFISTAGLLPNQKNKMFIGLDISKIKNALSMNKYALPKSQKVTEKFNDILTCDIKKSRLNMHFLKNIEKNKTENKNKDEEEDDLELTKQEIEKNFYVQATKETFDDLLLGNEEEDDEIKMLNEEDSENKNQKKMNFFEGNAGHKKKRDGKDDIENYLINSGFYNRPLIKGQNDEEKRREEEEAKKKEEEDKFIEKNRDKLFSNLYCKDLNSETILSLLEEQNDDDMEEYLMNKIKNIQEGMAFTNYNLINKVLKTPGTKTFLEKIILIFKYHFEVIKQFIDELFTSLVKNKENTPYIIRAICTIISKLLEIKFPNITNNQKISFISEFLFSNLIIPILINPGFNGIMMYNFEKRNFQLRGSKIILIAKVLKKLLRGELYDETKKNEENFTIFNSYFIEIMPHVIEFFRNISSTKLPINIEKLLEYRKNNANNKTSNENETNKDTNTSSNNNDKKEERNIEFDFLKAHPEERLEHQSMCITWKEFEAIYNIIKSNESGIVGEKEGIVYKTYRKMTFHENTLKKKMEADENNGKRTYIYLAKLVLDDELKEKIEAKRDKKFSFQSNETLSDLNNETFVLARVKYCINTIIKHLNALSRTNFFVDEKESTENFVKGLNKMISLEGFSEMLKEKSLPLEWFGLYLQSNIENIPSEYRSNNYSKLYSELIEESNNNLEKIQNDNSLNTIYSKIINSEKMIDISKNNLKRIKSNEKKFEILDFILKTNIPVTINVYRNREKEISHIEFVKQGNKSNYNPREDEELTTQNCNNIVEFCELFPFLSRENFTDILEFEEEINLKNSLNEYFNIIHEYVKEEKMFKEYKEVNEQTKIRIQIEDFIHAQIYDKIYSGMAVQTDIKIFQKCFTLKWVKPTMLNEKLTYLDEKMTQMMRSFIRNIDEEISPNNKLREFEKLDLIINNMITLYGYPNDVYLSIMAFAFIKGQPYQLNSSYKYIKMYYSEKLPKKRGIELIRQFEKLLDKITNFSEKDLVGISQEEYNKNIENIIISMSSSG